MDKKRESVGSAAFTERPEDKVEANAGISNQLKEEA